MILNIESRMRPEVPLDNGAAIWNKTTLDSEGMVVLVTLSLVGSRSSRSLLSCHCCCF